MLKKINIPEALLNPVKDFENLIYKVEPFINDAELANMYKAKSRMHDRLMPNVFKFEDAKNVSEYCNDNNIVCSFIAGDGRELKSWNTKNGDIHQDTDKEIKLLWGDIYANSIIEAGGIMCRDQGDEFHIVLPGYTKEQASELMDSIEEKALVKTKELNLDLLPSAKQQYGGLPIGSGIIDWGIAETIKGKMGEVERRADADMSARKIENALSKACEYNFDVTINPDTGKIDGFVSCEVDLPIGKNLIREPATDFVLRTMGKDLSYKVKQNESNLESDEPSWKKGRDEQGREVYTYGNKEFKQFSATIVADKELGFKATYNLNGKSRIITNDKHPKVVKTTCERFFNKQVKLHKEKEHSKAVSVGMEI